MAKITRTIEVPFEGCDRCRYLHLEEKSSMLTDCRMSYSADAAMRISASMR